MGGAEVRRAEPHKETRALIKGAPGSPPTFHSARIQSYPGRPVRGPSPDRAGTLTSDSQAPGLRAISLFIHHPVWDIVTVAWMYTHTPVSPQLPTPRELTGTVPNVTDWGGGVLHSLRGRGGLEASSSLRNPKKLGLSSRARHTSSASGEAGTSARRVGFPMLPHAGHLPSHSWGPVLSGPKAGNLSSTPHRPPPESTS